MKAKQGIKTGLLLGLTLLLFGSCKEEELYTIEEYTKNACTFHDKSIPNGKSVTAYSAKSLVYDAKCSSVAETRTCNDGELSGTFKFNSCVEEPPATCTFDNKTVAHNGFVEAYSSSSREWNESCGDVKAVRTCDNGTLSNTSHIYPTCAVKTPDNCTTVSGQFVEHTKTIEAFSTNLTIFDEQCTNFRVDLKCENGAFINHNSTTYKHPTCKDGEPDNCTLNGITRTHNDSYPFALASSIPYNSTCSYQSRTCKNGSFGGDSNYQHANCVVDNATDCTYTDTGVTFPHSFTAAVLYSDNESDFPQKCTDIQRTNVYCTNGIFSEAGYTNQNCQDGQAKTCKMTDNNSNSVIIPHDNSTIGYTTYSVGYDDSCDNVSGNLTCSDGNLLLGGVVTEAYKYTACSPGPPKKCNFNGLEKAHNSSFSAFSTSLIGWDASKVGLTDPDLICSDNRSTLTCNDGQVTGTDNLTHTFATCGMADAQHCTGSLSLDGKPVNHGDNVTAYKYNSSGNGGDCSDTIIRTCTNGSFSGDSAYRYDHCLNDVVLVGARGTGVSNLELTWIPLDNQSNYYREYFPASGYRLDEIPGSEVNIEITHQDNVSIGSYSYTNGVVNDEPISGSSTLSVMVIIDDSATMTSNDPSNFRYEAAKQLVDELPEGTDLKISDFYSCNLPNDNGIGIQETPTFWVNESSVDNSSKGTIKSTIDLNRRSFNPETLLSKSMFRVYPSIVNKNRNLLITLSDGKDTSTGTDLNMLMPFLNTKSAEIHNIGLYSGADPIDAAFKQMPNNANAGGSYREVTNASDLTSLFSNIGKTTSIGYGKVSGTPKRSDNTSITFLSGKTYTGKITIRNIQRTFTFTY